MKDVRIEKIEAYLNGKMGSEEQRNFEREPETDPVLLAAYNIYHAVETQMRNDKKLPVRTP